MILHKVVECEFFEGAVAAVHLKGTRVSKDAEIVSCVTQVSIAVSRNFKSLAKDSSITFENVFRKPGLSCYRSNVCEIGPPAGLRRIDQRVIDCLEYFLDGAKCPLQVSRCRDPIVWGSIVLHRMNAGKMKW